MIPSETEIRGIHYLTSENPPLFPQSFDYDFQNRYLSTLLTNLSATPYPHHELNNVVPSSSTSDEAEDHQIAVVDERKQRRMISNRESARRSRMRKQRQLDELWSQVVSLRTENHTLLHKLNSVSESHDKVLQENAKLREEASDLRQMVVDLQLGSSFTNAFADFHDPPCTNEAQLSYEADN